MCAMESKAAIEATQLSRDYGGGHGLFDLDITVHPGEVFGYLGPNGAGKSTTIRLLMGMARPTRGQALVFGLDCTAESVAVKRLVGYLPGELPQFGALTGSEVVAYLGNLRGGVERGNVTLLCDRFDLDLSRKFREYSRGNKQKLGLLLAFMHRPRLLVLDEPTGGLDPLMQQAFYATVAEARAAGATVFLSSHVLSEVEHTCDRVAILRGGRLVRVASLEELRLIRVHHVEVTFEGDVPEARIAAAAGVEGIVRDGETLRCVVRGSFEALMAAVAEGRVASFVSHEPSLEEAFLAYYQEPAGGDAAAP